MAGTTKPDSGSTPPTDSDSGGTQQQLLAELTRLARSVEQLAAHSATPNGSGPGETARRTAEFGYRMLGELMGRRRQPRFGEPPFSTPQVDASRDKKGVVLSGELHGATVARAHSGQTTEESDIRDGRITLTTIPSTAPIDLIVLFAGTNGPPVAVAPPLAPLYEAS